MSKKDITKRRKGEVIREAKIDEKTVKLPSNLVIAIILFILFLLLVVIF